MKTYYLPLKLKSGLLSDLQSDTIYGHFCWRLLEQSGESILTEFINLYREGKPVFSLSDGLLLVDDNILFPKPFFHYNKPYFADETKKDKILKFVGNKDEKEEQFLSYGSLTAYLGNTKRAAQKNYNGKLMEESLRVNVQIDRDSLTSSDGKLFSYNPKYAAENVRFAVLINIFDEDSFSLFECAEVLKDVFETGFGKKKSSGYGQFEPGDLEEYKIDEPENTNAFVVLGNYLTAPEDAVTPIGYKINTKYGRLGEQLSLSDNPFKNPIAFLTAGSCFQTTKPEKEFFGRVTGEGQISPSFPEVTQFGIPFSLKFRYEG